MCLSVVGCVCVAVVVRCVWVSVVVCVCLDVAVLCGCGSVIVCDCVVVMVCGLGVAVTVGLPACGLARAVFDLFCTLPNTPLTSEAVFDLFCCLPNTPLTSDAVFDLFIDLPSSPFTSDAVFDLLYIWCDLNRGVLRCGTTDDGGGVEDETVLGWSWGGEGVGVVVEPVKAVHDPSIRPLLAKRRECGGTEEEEGGSSGISSALWWGCVGGRTSWRGGRWLEEPGKW